jgi:hypothetical protein
MGVMLGAIWLRQSGPAIQVPPACGANLGFLPAYPIWDVEHWMPLLWNMALLAMASALAAGGPGAMAIDNALFRPLGGGGVEAMHGV